jgi:hypothetical protein
VESATLVLSHDLLHLVHQSLPCEGGAR